MSDQTLTDPIRPVLDRMHSMQTGLPRDDGIGRFNRLYREVTVAVDAAVSAGMFSCPEWVSALDVTFAGFYFEAIYGPIPVAWRPVFAARRLPRHPLQQALAGMCAHIVHDLPLAIVKTAEDTGVLLADDSAEHRDYLLVNDVLAAVEAAVKADYLDGDLELAGGPLLDVLALWDVREAREAAWRHARELWAVRRRPELFAAFDRMLAGATAVACRALLLPV